MSTSTLSITQVVLDQLPELRDVISTYDFKLPPLMRTEEEWYEEGIRYQRIGTLDDRLIQFLMLYQVLEIKYREAYEEVKKENPNVPGGPSDGTGEKYKAVGLKARSMRLLCDGLMSLFRSSLLQYFPRAYPILMYEEWKRLEFYEGGVIVLVTYPNRGMSHE